MPLEATDSRSVTCMTDAAWNKDLKVAGLARTFSGFLAFS